MTSFLRNKLRFLFLLALLPATPAYALTILVDQTDDVIDINPGDGVCDTDPAVSITRCSLRAAVQESNALSGADEIVLPPGMYSLNIAGTGEEHAATGDLDIRGDLTIRSNGLAFASTTIVDANQIDRVFDTQCIPATCAIHFDNFTIRGGRTPAGQLGGGINATWASSLTLSGMTITGNRADQGSTSSDIGGGIFGSTFGAGKIYLINSTLSNNTANRGGAIFSNSFITLVNTTISGNHAVLGGGIVNYGELYITNSTISGNTADNGSGAIYSNYDPSASSYMPLIRNSTIVNNSAPSAGGFRLTSNSEISLVNTIIANNSGGNCEFDGASAKFVNETYNISSDNSCGLAGAGDMENTDPKLGPLANNGGPTRTHLPQKNSPAIDAAFASLLPGVEKDQRGVSRPQGKRPDIGSVEVTEKCSFFIIPAKNSNTAAFCL